MSALDDRRQSAREAFRDANEMLADPIDEAIETATRVRINHDVMVAFLTAPDDPDDIAGPLASAFRAAGFEVEE